MTTRSVRYILKKALRRVGEETDYAEAPEEAYQDAFNHLIDMLDDWRSRGYVIFQNNPESIDDSLSSADPIDTLAFNLAVRIAPNFHYPVGREMVMQAGNTLRLLRNRVRRLPTWCKPCSMPRGSGNTYYFSRFFSGDTNNTVCTDTGIPIVTGTSS